MVKPTRSLLLCVVLGHVSLGTLEHELRAEPRADVLAPELTLALERFIASRPDAYTALDYHDLLADRLPALRDDFVRLIAEWPTRYKVRGQSFKSWLRRDAGSLWWLLEPSQRNPESSPVFATFCIASIARDLAAGGHYPRVLVLGGETTIAETVKSTCASAGIDVVRRASRSDPASTLAGLLVRRIRSGAALVFKRLVAARFPPDPDVPVDGVGVAFHTWCPLMWLLGDSPADRCYLLLPDRLQVSGVNTVYASALSGIPVTGLRRAAAEVRSLPREITSRMVWLERFIGWRRLAVTLVDVRLWLRFEWLLRADSTLRTSFMTASGVDLSGVLLRELRYAFAVQLPVLLVLAAQVEAFTRRYVPSRFVITLETYCYGRAVLYGIRRAGTGARVFGLQHSPVNKNQIFYRFLSDELQEPDAVLLPDDFLIHSRMLAEELPRAGVSPARLHLTGAPRFVSLGEHRAARATRRNVVRRELGLPIDERLVLVAGTIWPDETERLLEYAFAAAGREPVLVVKAHPAGADLTNALTRLKVAFPSVRAVESRALLQRLQSAVDVMVTGNSTSDVEAVAIGCPVIRIRASALNSSPTSDVPRAILDVNTANELRSALSAPVRLADTSVVESALGPCDEGVYDRVAAVLVEPAG